VTLSPLTNLTSTYRPGSVVIYTSDLNQNRKSRPYIVLFIKDKGIRLCPLTCTPLNRPDAPIPAGAGNLTLDSWVAATDRYHRINQLVWAQPAEIKRKFGQLTEEQFNTVLLVANTQMQRRKNNQAKVVVRTAALSR
jgi:hypothetical protein